MGTERRRISTTQTGGRNATTGVIPGRYSLSVGMPDSIPPKGWQWTPLSSVSRLESGHTPSRNVSDYWDGDIPWVGIRDATANHGRSISTTNQKVTQAGIDNSSARVLPAGTVCLSRTASVGYVVVMGCPMATSQDFVNWICSDKIDNHFLKYVLLSEHESLLRFASGTTHQTIYYPEAKAFHVCLPKVAEQRTIARILCSLDDKIELNRKMNRTLEAMAQALFKAWFVDFEPVKAKAAGRTPESCDAETAALFPDEFVESELGAIPKGWEVKGLDKVANFINGLALQKFPPKSESDFLPVIKIAQLRKGDTEGSDKASRNLDPAYIVQNGDVLFSWSGSLEVELWCGGEGALNQHLFKVTSSLYPKWFYYLWTRKHLPNFREIAAHKATTMGHIQRHHLTQAKVIVPPAQMLEKISTFVEPYIAGQIRCSLESRTLATLRDSLLPKLISGQFRIPAAEALAEAAV